MNSEDRLALVRVLLWEQQDRSNDLQCWLRQNGHPFVVRDSKEIYDVDVPRDAGVFVELFVLPIDLDRLLKWLRQLEDDEELQAIFEIADLPRIIVRRHAAARESSDFREFNAILKCLPRWLPDAGRLAAPYDLTRSVLGVPLHGDLRFRNPRNEFL